MKKTVMLSIIVGTFFVGTIGAMGRRGLGAFPEQVNEKQARQEEEMRRREQLAQQDRQRDAYLERMNREYRDQQYLENMAEGAYNPDMY